MCYVAVWNLAREEEQKLIEAHKIDIAERLLISEYMEL
jgi:hypothetical protein